MRKFTSLKMFMVVTVLLFTATKLSAQLLVENFEYTVGSVLTSTTTANANTGWLAQSSGNGTENVTVTDGLSFTGYLGTGVGGAAYIDNSGQDIYKQFTAQTSGTLYVSFMVKVESNTTAGYFLNLGKNTIGTTYFSRLFVNASGTGLGLSTNNTEPSYVSITTGNTYVVVLKHDFTAHESKLFVLSSYSSTEPATADQTISETNTEIGSIQLRQFNAGQKQIVDGIRIATSWAEACAPASSTPKAATPTFTVVPGYVTSTQNVGIECSTAGAEIRYTTNGDDPTETSTLYTTPISVSTTTTIKAKAFKSGMDASSVASATYTFPTEVANIANLKAASTTGFYKLTTNALVTYSSTTFGKTTYLQDATGGIMLYDNDSKLSTAFNIGDILSDLYCTLKDYNGMLELIPAQAPTLVSSGNTVNAKTATIAELINYPGELVKVNGITVSDISGGTGMFASGKSYTISDGINSTVIRTSYTDLPYLGYLIPTGSLDITGVVLLYTSSGTTTAQLVPRTLTDFSKTLIASTSNPSSKSGIYALDGKVILTAEAGDVVEVFNAVGQRLVSVKAVSGENHIPVAAKGIVMVRTKGQSTKVVL